MIDHRMFSITKLVMTESIPSPIVWWWKKFGCHTIGDEKISIVVGLAIEKISWPNLQRPKKFHYNKLYGDWNGLNFDRP